MAATRSTLYGVVESILESKGTSFTVLVPDLLDEGKGYEEITERLRDMTGVPMSSRTVRRWTEKAAA